MRRTPPHGRRTLLSTVKLVETMHFLGAPDRLAQLQLHQATDQRITEEQADQERGEPRAESPEGNVLEDIERLVELDAVQKSELREIVEHRDVTSGVEEFVPCDRSGLP